MINGFYINLEERKDRVKHFENLKNNYPFFKNIIRFNAIRNENGAIGCGLSHIKVLTKLLECQDEYMMVIEDDLCILNDNNYNDFVKYFENIRNEMQWDIILLTPRGEKKYIDNGLQNNYNTNMHNNHFFEIVNSQTTTGYIIKKSFIPILINNLKQSIQGLIKKLDPNTYAIDQYWKRLQNDNHFYYFNKIFAGQLIGYSDIEKRYINYNQRFLSQQ